MTRSEFFEFLKENNIDHIEVSFEPNPLKDGYCVRKNYFCWEVFIRERGKDYEVMGFPSESDALLYLANKLTGKFKND